MDRPQQDYLKRWTMLKLEMSTWVTHWWEISQNFAPHRWRYLQTERNRGWKKNDKIINATPLLALRVLASGLMAGLTSPARPWFRLTTEDPDLGDYGPVREWLEEVEIRTLQIFARSNIYKCLSELYSDVGGFGTHCTLLEEDPHTVIRGYVMPLGSYCLANGARQEVDTFYRHFSMTSGQLMQRYGKDNVSPFVKTATQNKNRDLWVQCLQIVEPNTDYDPGRGDAKGKLWRSATMEISAYDAGTGSGAAQPTAILPDKFLNESGYDDFPALVARWNSTGEDVYGYSPGMDALGDAKALQVYEKRKAQVMDKIVNPPMVGDVSLRTARASLLPGEITYVPGLAAGGGFKPAVEMPPGAIPAADGSIEKLERRIQAVMFSDLFTAILNDERQMTALEVSKRYEEKMLLIGPALERLEGEALDPLVHRTISILLRNGMLPPPPQELHGQMVKPEYISIMAQAQKLLGISNNERFVQSVTAAAQAQMIGAPILDVIDFDELARDDADRLGVDPKVLKDEDVIKQTRDQRAQAQQAQAQGQALAVAAKGAQHLGSADVGSDTALGKLMGGLGPAAQANTGTGQ